MKLNRKDCALPVIVVVALISFVCIALFSEWPWRESPWVAASAIATLLAAGIALWFGSQDARHREDERERAIGVYQKLFVPDVGQAVPALNSIEDFIDKAQRECTGFVISPDELAYLDELRTAVSAKIINQHLEALPYLNPSLGQALARVATNGAIISARLQLIRINPMVTDTMKKFLRGLRPLIQDMRGAIDDTRWLEVHHELGVQRKDNKKEPTTPSDLGA